MTSHDSIASLTSQPLHDHLLSSYCQPSSNPQSVDSFLSWTQSLSSSTILDQRLSFILFLEDLLDFAELPEPQHPSHQLAIHAYGGFSGIRSAISKSISNLSLDDLRHAASHPQLATLLAREMTSWGNDDSHHHARFALLEGALPFLDSWPPEDFQRFTSFVRNYATIPAYQYQLIILLIHELQHPTLSRPPEAILSFYLSLWTQLPRLASLPPSTPFAFVESLTQRFRNYWKESFELFDPSNPMSPNASWNSLFWSRVPDLYRLLIPSLTDSDLCHLHWVSLEEFNIPLLFEHPSPLQSWWDVSCCLFGPHESASHIISEIISWPVDQLSLWAQFVATLPPPHQDAWNQIVLDHRAEPLFMTGVLHHLFLPEWNQWCDSVSSSRYGDVFFHRLLNLLTSLSSRTRDSDVQTLVAPLMTQWASFDSSFQREWILDYGMELFRNLRSNSELHPHAQAFLWNFLNSHAELLHPRDPSDLERLRIQWKSLLLQPSCSHEQTPADLRITPWQTWISRLESWSVHTPELTSQSFRTALRGLTPRTLSIDPFDFSQQLLIHRPLFESQGWLHLDWIETLSCLLDIAAPARLDSQEFGHSSVEIWNLWLDITWNWPSESQHALWNPLFQRHTPSIQSLLTQPSFSFKSSFLELSHRIETLAVSWDLQAQLTSHSPLPSLSSPHLRL